MGNLIPIFEGVTVGFLAALILLLICIIVIKRRSFFKILRNKESEYTPLDAESSNENFLEDRLLNASPVAQTHCTTVQPHRVTWATPVIDGERKRSISCPPARRNGVVDLGLKPEEVMRKSAETPSATKERKRRSYRRSKTDSWYHVCQIQFTVFYNYYHSKLTLQLLCAVNIPSSFGLNYGSYMEVEILPRAEKAKTNIQLHTNNPVFDETAEFPEITSDELLNMSLKFKLFTIDRFSHSTLVGYVQAPLEELDINPKKPTTIWRPIIPRPCDQQRKISSSLLSLEDILDRGELTISLKYQILTNKITVVIMKAVNLPNISKIFAIDPYVIVKLLLDLKTVQTKKTSIKRRTTSPCWNEPLVFEVDSKVPISEYSMSFKVKSHNSLSEDPTVGEVELGYHTVGSGREHWKDMIIRKNQDRAMSHKIK